MTKESEPSARDRYEAFQKEMRTGKAELPRTFEKPETEAGIKARYERLQESMAVSPGQQALNKAAGLPEIKHAPSAEPEPEPDAQDSYKRFQSEARPMRSDLTKYGHGELSRKAEREADAELKSELSDSLTEEIMRSFGQWITKFKRDSEQRPKDIELPDFSGEIEE